MEKRKVFKISIIDKEISRTEFDRNTFYTSDSELTLVFKLIERDYTYEHGEILLYNEDDKSFVTRKITKQENDFVYEIESDIIPHYGTWKAQLQLVNDGDVYTSKPFDFKIVNDLSNLAPQPTLTDINNWSTLKQSANELIDEMQDIIVDVEQAESERASKENLRQQSESERVSKENVRQNSELKRENQENTRQNSESKRENNEKQRRISEFERVDKENTRQQAESQRKSTFEMNETERQTTFETAEQERQSAELIRVENETLRVERDTKRETEIADIKDDIVYYGGIELVNLLENGNFSEGYTNWVKHAGVSLTSVDDYVNVQTTSNYAGIYQNNLIMTNTNKYYGYCYAKSTVKVQLNTTNSSVGEFNTGENFSLLSTIFEKTPVRFPSFGVALVTPGVFSIKEVGLIDLTKIFGKGNEPTKQVMDWIIKENGYFNELTLRRDDIQQYEINQLRKAVIALGGTI